MASYSVLVLSDLPLSSFFSLSVNKALANWWSWEFMIYQRHCNRSITKLKYPWVINLVTIYTELNNRTLNIAAIQILKNYTTIPVVPLSLSPSRHTRQTKRKITRSLHNVCITMLSGTGIQVFLELLASNSFYIALNLPYHRNYLLSWCYKHYTHAENGNLMKKGKQRTSTLLKRTGSKEDNNAYFKVLPIWNRLIRDVTISVA